MPRQQSAEVLLFNSVFPGLTCPCSKKFMIKCAVRSFRFDRFELCILLKLTINFIVDDEKLKLSQQFIVRTGCNLPRGCDNSK